jgi:hypothetical protein
MTLAELEAALTWLERNRLCDHLHHLEGDPRYAWTAARRRRSVWDQWSSHSSCEAKRSPTSANIAPRGSSPQ